ncbi:MAG TPA: Asp-tRNA(Asn)/Glu-tRNA(Gln) amidotransferase subunit GatC [Myxococcales bacterium]
MAIDRAQVRHVARLARLALSAEEEERFAAQLQHVLGYIERLQQVDVSGVLPLSFAGDVSKGLPLRADEPGPCLPREKVLAQAPQADEETFLVPRIIE